MNKWNSIFPQSKPMIGMIHVKALPGTPGSTMSINGIIASAIDEALVFNTTGFDAIILENMHDIPYLNKNVGPEITAGMAVVAKAVREVFKKPVGIQILAAANKEALAVALSAGLDFIRAEGFVFGHVADEGYIDSCAGELLRYRKNIGAEDIAIFTDIKKKHSAHSITSDVSIGETASAAEFFLSDGLIVTGTATGKAADQDDLKAVREHSGLPVIIGSGITNDNLSSFWHSADGFIIGSYIKENGLWSNSLSAERCKMIIDQADKLRKIN